MSEANGRGRYRQASPRHKGVHWMDKAILPFLEVEVGDVLVGALAIGLFVAACYAMATGSWIEVM